MGGLGGVDGWMKMEKSIALNVLLSLYVCKYAHQ